MPSDHQIRTSSPLLPSSGRLWKSAQSHPIRSDSPQRVSGVYRALLIPPSFLPASYPGFTPGAPVLAMSLLTLIPSLRKTCTDERRPSEEASLSALSFACHFVVYDAECFCNSPYFEDFLLGCYCLANNHYSSKFIKQRQQQKQRY